MNNSTARERWLKAELHTHCSQDPSDYRLCDYSPEQLISEAARLRYDILAITCHNLDVWTRDLCDYAESLGITLIPGMEVTVGGRFHTLVYNFRTGCENLDTMEKIRVRSREDTLVIAPHAYYPSPTCLRSGLERNIDVFDAVEQSGFYTRHLDFNGRALKTAARHKKPVVGNGDVHLLWQLGRTFTWVYAEPGVVPIVSAIRRGKIRVESSPFEFGEVARWWATTLWRSVFPVHPAPTRLSDPLCPSGQSVKPV